MDKIKDYYTKIKNDRHQRREMLKCENLLKEMLKYECERKHENEYRKWSNRIIMDIYCNCVSKISHLDSKI